MTVRCSEYKTCPQLKEFGEFTCEHYGEHEPIKSRKGDCSMEWWVCPLIKPLVVCLPVEPQVDEDHEAMVADIGNKPSKELQPA